MGKVEGGVEGMTEPRYSVGDEVVFGTARHEGLSGVVAVVDYRGRDEGFEGCEWSYDIMVGEHPDTGRPCMWKHISERRLTRVPPRG